MPIRFRCAYCNQLMGIASRKAGTVVRCPKCAGEIIVPAPEGAADPGDGADQAGAQAFDVEQLDLGVEPANGSAGPIAAPPAEQAPTESLPAPNPTSTPPPPQRVGVFVPLGMLIISVGVVVLLLILLFVIGLIIGRATMIP